MAFNPDQFLSEDQAPPSPGVTPPQPSHAEDFNIDRFLNDGQAVDQNTGDLIPLAFSGNSPETAMNRSPLSDYDRLKLSLGNEAGNIKFLKDRFDDVKPILDDKGQPSKELAVRKGDTWFRVDPINGEIADPWEKTKEYMNDLAEFGPEAIGLATGAATTLIPGAGPLVAGGVAGATSGAVRTSLGRLVGTYDATPAEQAWDIGFETLLNAAGGKILAGVKPSAKWVANKLDDIASVFKETVEPLTKAAEKSDLLSIQSSGQGTVLDPRTLFKKIMSSYSVGENNFDTAVENPKQLKSLMRNLHDMSGGNVAAYHDEALRQQLGNVKRIADNTRTTLSDIYGSMRNNLLKSVPKDFTVNLDQPVYAAYQGAIDRGIGKLMVGGKELTGKEAADYIAKNGMKNTGFKLLSQEEMAKAIQQGANLDKGLGYLTADKEAYNIIKEYYDNIGKFIGGQNRSGVEGARALLDFKKVATDLSYKMSNTEAARGTPEIKALIDQSKVAMDNSIFQEFKKRGQGNAFTQINSTYNELNKKFAPLLRANAQYKKSRDIKTYESLLNTFLARPGKNASSRFAIDEAIVAADANGLKDLSKALLNDKKAIMIGEAAKAFNPLKSGQLKADSLGAGQAGLLGYAALSQNPALLAAAIGVQTLRSPQTAKAGLAVTQAMSGLQQIITKMPKDQLDNFLSSPEAMNAAMTALTSSPQIRSEAEGGLQQMIDRIKNREQ